MKICALSDLHGFLIDNIQPCELVLICGDIVPLEIQRDMPQSTEWLKTEFANWVKSLPCEEVMFTAGNHDLVLENRGVKWIENTILVPTKAKAMYLEDSYYDYLSNDGKVYRIYGTPACHIFGNWAFMYSDEQLRDLYWKIPGECDILLSHDAPYGTTDICLQKPDKGHLGNIPLRDVILDTGIPYVFHGHLHSSNHEFETLGDSKVANCSIVDEYYQIKYEPLYLDI